MFRHLQLPHHSLAILLLAACALLAPIPASADLTGRASVIDGDTIEIHGTRIRMNGIDAPESGQHCYPSDGTTWRCGQASAWHLDQMVRGNTVECHVLDRDRYGREIADCFVGQVNLNARMVRDGLAVAYRRYSRAYIAEENAARAEGVGIWATQFDMPWDWRRRN